MREICVNQQCVDTHFRAIRATNRVVENLLQSWHSIGLERELKNFCKSEIDRWPQWGHLTMTYLISLIQKKTCLRITPTVSQIFPSARDAKAGPKKPMKEKTAARITDNQKNTENEIPNARGIANQIIIPLRKPKPADIKAIASRSVGSGLSMSLLSLRFRTFPPPPLSDKTKSNRGSMD